MGERRKIGVRVDADLWDQFVSEVEERKGQKRGVLGDELENAIRNYIHHGTEKSTAELFAEFNERLHRVEQSIGTVSADGGVDISEPSEHTHAPRVVPDEKPAANAPTEKKTAWLAAAFVSEYGPGDGSPPDQIPEAKVREFVKDAYGFRKDTAKRYVTAVIERHGYVDHPDADGILQLPDAREAYLAEQREEATDDTDQEMQAIDNAEREEP
jgi:hypothetical protein